MASRYEHEAWGRLGGNLANIFQDYGRQRQDAMQFKAQMALAELERRDRKDARDKEADINRRTLEINEQRLAREIKFQDETRADQDELDEMYGGYAEYLGGSAIGEADGKLPEFRAGGGPFAGVNQARQDYQDYMASGMLPEFRAGVASLHPSLQGDTPTGKSTPPKSQADYVYQLLQSGEITKDQAGEYMQAVGMGAFEPKDITIADLELYSVLGPDNLPPHMQAYRGTVEREHNYLLESREPDYFTQAQEAYKLGGMAYSTEGEMEIPEHMKDFAEFDRFFEGGKKAMIPRYSGGGGIGGVPLPDDPDVPVEPPTNAQIKTELDKILVIPEVSEGGSISTMLALRVGELENTIAAYSQEGNEEIALYANNVLRRLKDLIAQYVGSESPTEYGGGTPKPTGFKGSPATGL